ncbi:MAG: ATP synthase F1 subunit gamma [Kiritimatiellia bacterium]|nr:ATP synthase F1 subunit gamma [Kiritimatiellia bacterium]
MANPREIKNRLRGVRKTQQITRAMKMVASVKLRRAQAALANGRPYAERMQALAADLLARIDPSLPPDSFFLQRQAARATPGRENILLIIVAADRGLCGNMNTNIFRQALRAIDDWSAPEHKGQKPVIDLFLIGRKTKDFFRTRQNIRAETPPYRIREAVNFADIDAGDLGRQCCELYRKGEFDRIELFYNESSGLQHHAVRVTLLPLNLAQMRKDAGRLAGNILFEPALAEMMDDVICGWIISKVRKILMEAEVAEHAARMLMMDLATKNADDLIAAMQLTMNKLRQLSITSELADITTGAEAVG